MKFVLLIYQGATPLPNTPEWSGLSKAELDAIYADYGAINRMEGVTPGPPLSLPAGATTVRVKEGRRLTANGPYASGGESPGGYMVLEAENLNSAITVAARIPAARHGGGIEIRPVSKYW
ncbi:MAG TPA: YciI family protein [Tepidiformaceae bacterium]|nr:YciI family protein [Tepidiformaceae bacterium]